MKKLFTFFLALIASAVTIFASDIQIDGIWYDFDDSSNTASVTYHGYYYDFENEYSGIVTIPASVSYNDKTYSITSIGDEAFYGCDSLTSITIPSSVTSIGESAFNKCTGLTSVHISDIAAWCAINFSNNYSSNPLVYAHNLYLNDELITNLVIPYGVTNIGDYVFHGCTCLTSVTIPNSVTRIGYETFEQCVNLASVTIPNSVTSIGQWAFNICSSLISIEIPNSVTSIGSYAFEDCTSLTSVVAPASIFEVNEEYWTRYTHSLESVTFNGGELTYNVLGILSRSNKTLNTLDISAVSNTELDDEAFKGFYNLRDLQLPANLTKIGYMAVADCKNLQSINIPASVTEISQSAFENCRSLKTITFGGQAVNVSGRLNAPATSTSQLQKIGNWAFYNCHELQNLTIPEGVTEIGDGAFYGCTYLEGLSLPASVQSIGDNTFALCAKLQKIVVNAPVPPSIQAKTFFDVQRQIPVYVPDESISAYKNDALWGEFDIQGISNMPQGLDQISQQPTANSRKMIKNGQILILRGKKVYTLQGQEVR